MSAELETYDFLGIPTIVASGPMRKLLDVVRRVARSNASVLITGESGAGKEIIARALHHYSARAEQPWIDVSCGALAEHLIESELFGHEKGAFSGAYRSKPGFFEMAHGGTLFLDEIGELEPRMQVKLLRVLDGFSYFRVGGVNKTTVDVRVVAATNRHPFPATNSSGFRRDLYHRLSQVHLEVPPLRRRIQDITALSEYFLKRQDPRLRFTKDALRLLENHCWPGNVRELRNVVSRASFTCADCVVRVSDLLPSIQADNLSVPEPENSPPTSPTSGTALRLDEIERRAILHVMESTGGEKQLAANMLGISIRTLHRKLRSYSIGLPEKSPANGRARG